MSQIIQQAKKVLTKFQNNLRRYEKAKGEDLARRADLKAIADLINHAAKLELQEIEDENNVADHILYIGELKSQLREKEDRLKVLEIYTDGNYEKLIEKIATDLKKKL